MIRAKCESDAHQMEAMIAEIVEQHGKLQNPWTGSGGALVGRLRTVGASYRMPELRPGDEVMPLASLIAIPLRLDEVGTVTPDNPTVPVRGRARRPRGSESGSWQLLRMTPLSGGKILRGKLMSVAWPLVNSASCRSSR